MQGNLGLTPVQAPCKGCADRHTGCHTDCTRYIAFRREADRYKQEQSKDAARYATTRGLYADAARCEPRKAGGEATLLMSTPRYGWWAYAKWMIRSYKGGGLMTKAKRAAVADAIAETEQLVDGAERLRLIDLVLWKRTHTLQGAAMAVYVSERTAQEWHRQFIRLVGQKRGLL